MTSMDLYKKLVPVCLMIVFVLICVLFLIFPPNGKLVCSLKSAPGETYALYTYTIDFKLWKATSFLSEERLVSKDIEFLKKVEEDLKVSLEKDNKLEYFSNEMSLGDNELTIKTNIDYILLKKSLKNGQTKPKLGIRLLKKAYTNIGANCKYQ